MYWNVGESLSNAKDIVKAGRITKLLKKHGVAAFSQEAGASVAMHGASGFGMYGVDVLVKTDEAKKALRIIETADDSQSVVLVIASIL